MLKTLTLQLPILGKKYEVYFNQKTGNLPVFLCFILLLRTRLTHEEQVTQPAEFDGFFYLLTTTLCQQYP